MSPAPRNVCFLSRPAAPYAAFVFLLVCLVDSGSVRDVHAASGLAQGSRDSLIIRPVSQASWDADVRDVEKVLYSAADQLWRYFPEKKLPVILVEPQGGPVFLDRRGPNGELQIRLATSGTYWSQYAFQFAHEFAHVLCGRRPPGGDHLWFEESICEAASLFVLRRMAKQWETDPPYAHWKVYAASLRQYADRRMQQAPLPSGLSLAQWYRRHADALRTARYDRAKNRVVAGALLPLFEQSPMNWAAVSYLRWTGSGQATSFAKHLAAWHDRSPQQYRSFIRKLAGRFGIELPAGPAQHGADSDDEAAQRTGDWEVR